MAESTKKLINIFQLKANIMFYLGLKISLEELARRELIHRGITDPTWEQVYDLINKNKSITYAKNH